MHIKKTILYIILSTTQLFPSTIERKLILKEELSERIYNRTLISKVCLASIGCVTATILAYFFNTLIYEYQQRHGRHHFRLAQSTSAFIHHLERYAIPASLISNLYWLYNHHRIGYLNNTLENLQTKK